jgi:hypothetical protein
VSPDAVVYPRNRDEVTKVLAQLQLEVTHDGLNARLGEPLKEEHGYSSC